MSNRLRSILYHKIHRQLENPESDYKCLVRSGLSLSYDDTKSSFYMNLPTKTKEYQIDDGSIARLASKDDDNGLFRSIQDPQGGGNRAIKFAISRDDLLRNVLDDNAEKLEAPTDLLGQEARQKEVVVEFSSPNIAKPFHVGHLRSTILGNYVSNVLSYTGHRVRRINYLGDWGTQLGLLQVGLQLGFDSLEKRNNAMKKDPIQTLYQCYVLANTRAENDPKILEEARSMFEKMENSNDKDTGMFGWEEMKAHTTEELKKTYARIGVAFDEYHWESMYRASRIKYVIAALEAKGLLTTDSEGRKVATIGEEPSVPVVKSDGSTLYITRDIAAALDRFQRYDFHAMYYVVDSGQSQHFNKLLAILKAMEIPWAGRLKHVGFGKIKGMSTRSGQVVFLTQLLDEMRNVMLNKQLNSANTKVSMDLTDNSADALGISAVIINDFKNKRNCHYDFSWDKALDVKGKTGVNLQYTHARLVSLEENCGASLATKCEPSMLREPCVDQLVLHIGQFEQVLLHSQKTLEPYIMVSYLFKLSSSINAAFNALRIKSESAELGSQRLLLFRVARNVLAQGMRLLGITPLSKI